MRRSAEAATHDSGRDYATGVPVSLLPAHDPFLQQAQRQQVGPALLPDLEVGGLIDDPPAVWLRNNRHVELRQKHGVVNGLAAGAHRGTRAAGAPQSPDLRRPDSERPVEVFAGACGGDLQGAGR